MKTQGTTSLVARLAGASLVCLFILSITLPNLGRPVRPNPAIKQGWQVVYGWQDALCIAIIIAPLILIFIGAARSRAAEYVGWVLLLTVVILRFVSFAML